MEFQITVLKPSSNDKISLNYIFFELLLSNSLTLFVKINNSKLYEFYIYKEIIIDNLNKMN